MVRDFGGLEFRVNNGSGFLRFGPYSAFDYSVLGVSNA
jgi:hypothetical protein